MSGITGKAAEDADGLRERNVSIQAKDDDEARRTVLHLNDLEENAEKTEKDKKTFGRTPDGIGKREWVVDLHWKAAVFTATAVSGPLLGMLTLHSLHSTLYA